VVTLHHRTAIVHLEQRTAVTVAVTGIKILFLKTTAEEI
jgi:hypothetical protein